MRPLPQLRLLPLCAALLGLAAPLAAQLPAQIPAGSRAVESRHALPPDGFVRLWNLAGTVHVVAWDMDSVVVTGDAPSDVGFFCGRAGQGVKCATNVPLSDEAADRAAHLEVRVPRRASVWVKSASAEISITAAAGNVEAYSVTGAIRVTGNSPSVLVETMGGDIAVSGRARSLRARTASGAIAIRADADEADVSSVTGTVDVSGGTLRHGRVESIDGRLRWTAPPSGDARLELVSHDGAIDVHLPRGAGGIFAVSSYRGVVTCTVAGAHRTHDAARRETTFTLAPVRDALLTIRTFKGPVTISRD